MIKRAEGASSAPADFEDAERELSRADKREKSKRSVYIYIATLFIIVLLFTLLSYFVQNRNNSEISTLTQKNATAQLNIENLQSENLRLREDSVNEKKQLATLAEQVAVLEKQLTALQQKLKDELSALTTQDKQKFDVLQGQYNALLEQYNALVKLNGAR